MISSLSISKTATFGETPVMIDDLLQFNYFYGSNGTGKTTISRLLNDNSNPDFVDCAVNYIGVARPDIFVFNRDFVEEKMSVSSAIPGIFTFADENEEARQQLKDLADKISEDRKTLEGLNKSLGGLDGKSGEIERLRALDEKFKSKCWSQKKKYDNDFKEAFTGCRSDSEKF